MQIVNRPPEKKPEDRPLQEVKGMERAPKTLIITVSKQVVAAIQQTLNSQAPAEGNLIEVLTESNFQSTDTPWARIQLTGAYFYLTQTGNVNIAFPGTQDERDASVKRSAGFALRPQDVIRVLILEDRAFYMPNHRV